MKRQAEDGLPMTTSFGLRCSFCDKSQSEVRKLIAGKNGMTTGFAIHKGRYNPL